MQESSAAVKEGPRRMCAGCRQRDAGQNLLRFALSDQTPYVVPDLRRRLGGYGVSVHPRRRCVEEAVRRGGFRKLAQGQLPADRLLELASDQYRRRIEGLLGAARRAGALAIGAQAVAQSIEHSRARLMVVAADAGSSRGPVEQHASTLDAPCVVFSDKRALGAAVGYDQVAVAAVLDAGFAKEICHALERSQALAVQTSPQEASEVR